MDNKKQATDVVTAEVKPGSRKDRATSIILAYASAHATVALLLANTIVGDAVVLTPLPILMIYQLAKLCGRDLETSAIAALTAQLFGAVSGGYLASKLVSWIPGVGNTINATVTFGITQVIGWAAFAMFDLSGSAKLMSQFLKPKAARQHTGLMETLGRRKALQVMDKLVDLLFQRRVLMVSANGGFRVSPEVFQRIEVGAAGGQP